MSGSVHLRVVATEQPNSVQFQILFPVPQDEMSSPCAIAMLETGDGRVEEIGLVCAPTADTWAMQHMLPLFEHTYADAGPYIATLAWGDDTATVAVEFRDNSPSDSETVPTVDSFHLEETSDSPLAVDVRLALSEVREWHTVRVDGGAGNVHIWKAQSNGIDVAPSPTNAMYAEWVCTYAKPGPYTVYVDLIDDSGFWLARLVEFPFDIAAPIVEPDSAVHPQPPAAGSVPSKVMTPIDTGSITDNLPPWIPYRYVRPLWAWTRTYTQPGGTVISRFLALGTYLAIKQEVEIGGELWYQSTSNDWAPASSVAEIVPSTLQGVELGDVMPPDPPPVPPDPPIDPPVDPPPVAVRTGVVIANVLNVRSGPGTHNPVVGKLRYNSDVEIFEEGVAAGAVWYRIGTGRWVHSAWVRLTNNTPPVTPPVTPPDTNRKGIVTAHVLNVRAKPGVRSDNPPVDKLLRNAPVTIYEEALSDGAIWYRIGIDRWVHSGWVRIVDSDQSANVDDNGSSRVWALPVGWVTSTSLMVRARPGVDADNPVVGTVSHNEALSILDTTTIAGQRWYRIGTDRWVYSGSVGVARFRPKPSTIGSQERWVGVNLREQTLVAYEGDKPVYAALVATGMYRTPTVRGVFRTWWRLISRKMSGGSAATGGYYYLEEVPWTCYFYGGYALHGAYWHDGFGIPRSHGCINLSLYDAWWIYQWSERGGANSPAVYVYWE